MKKLLILLILLAVFWVYREINSESIAANRVENVKEIQEIQPLPLATPKPKSAGDINQKVGIVDVNNDDQIICLRTKNAALTKQASVLIITSLHESPQKILTAAVEKKLERSCVSDDADAGELNPETDSYYSLILTDKNIEKSELGIGIGVIQPVKPIQVLNDLAVTDLNEDGEAEFFRLCASNEGLHLTIWTGKPLSGKRIWHSYYYLHYDTEADCKKKDWDETED